MMKKTAAILMCVLMLFSMTACSESQASSQSAAAPAASTNVVEEYIDLIPSVKAGEIYFDVHVTDAIKNFTVKADGTAVETGRSIPFTDKTQITFEGEADADKSVDIYIVFGTKDGDYFRFNQSISKGLDADRALDQLSKKISDVLSVNNKILVIITEKPGDWDHTISDKLNDFLDQYVSK